MYAEANSQRNTNFGISKFDCADKKCFGHARMRTGLLDKKTEIICTWNWLVIYDNLVCHSTGHWLSLDNADLHDGANVL